MAIDNFVAYCAKHPNSPTCKALGDPEPDLPGGSIFREILQIINNPEAKLQPTQWSALALLLDGEGLHEDALAIARLAEEQASGSNYRLQSQNLQTQASALSALERHDEANLAFDMAERLAGTARLQQSLLNR